MAYQLSTAQVWEALKNLGMDGCAKVYARNVEMLTKSFADLVGEKLGIAVGEARMDFHELGGVTVCVAPGHEGQAIPAAITGMDAGSSWEEGLPSHDLSDAFGGVWGRHPQFPVSNWKHEVENGDTRLGYWAWVKQQLENQT